jgi:ABC-type sugar transport system ATPase subunit
MDIRGSSPAREVILGVENVSKELPGLRVLSNVSFRGVEVEIHCLVGENGFLL